MSDWIEISGRRVGLGCLVYVIAELSANHGGDLACAVELVRAAKAAGADAIKLQTYTAETLTLRSDREQFRIASGTIWDGRTLFDLYQEAATPWEWHERLRDVAKELGLDCFSTPFDRSAVDFLEGLGVPAYKVASFEIVDTPLIEYIAARGRPMIVSTGMATLGEIEDAVTVARRAGARGLALLKCVSAYPARAEDMNLATIPHMARTFGVPVGLSDHTIGIAVPVAAVALGACIVEKHLTLSRQRPGPDAAFSSEPDEFRAMVQAIRQAEKAVGSVRYVPTADEMKNRVFRRSLFVADDVKAGELFTEHNVRSIRPGHGLAPRHLPDVLGKRAARDIERGTPLSWDLVAGA